MRLIQFAKKTSTLLFSIGCICLFSGTMAIASSSTTHKISSQLVSQDISEQVFKLKNIAEQIKQPIPKTLLVPQPPHIHAAAHVLMDADSGAVIVSENKDKHLEPASLTKLMTLYLTFSALKNKQIHLNDPVLVSRKAWRTGGSRMFIKVGNHVSIDHLIQGIAVTSGNDACVAMAEHIAGTESAFANLMNQAAKKLGMNHTHFLDASGLLNHANHITPNNLQHYSSAYDLALLAQALVKEFPKYYHYFSQKDMTYNHIRQPNRNRLLNTDASVDGLKTGYTHNAGYCLVTSAKRKKMRLITVLLGTHSTRARASLSEALLNYGFRFYKTQELYAPKQNIIKQRVWFAKYSHLPFGTPHGLYITTPINMPVRNLQVMINLKKHLKAPIRKGVIYGTIEAFDRQHNKRLASAPLVALKDDPKGSIWKRGIDHLIQSIEKS